MKNILRFDECLAFINCQLAPGHELNLHPKPAPKWRAVTISREAGCGASAIADKLQKKLQACTAEGSRPWTIFDENLVEFVLANHNLSKRIAEFMPEARAPIISDIVEELFGLHPAAGIIARQTAETILHLAELGNVILIGRGGNVITRRLPFVFHVRLIGSEERRIARIRAAQGLDRKTALELIHQKDRGRAAYVQQHLQQDINNPLLYHLTVNTDKLSADEAARIISDTMLHVEAFVAKAVAGVHNMEAEKVLTDCSPGTLKAS